MELKENGFFDERQRYRLIRKLGSGGFSEVWLAEDTKANNMEVALKIYASAGGLDEDAVKMFSNEFALLFNMSHSNLLKPTYFDDYQNRPYLIMPFCKNGSANKLVGKISEEEAWHFLHDVAAGLSYLHQINIIHQDISTENILINANGDYLITDFGISTQARNTLRKSVINAQTSHQSGGKVDFMAPELFGTKNEAIKASDIWALGVTLFELLEGRLPFPIGLGGLAQKGGADMPEISGNYSQKLKDIVYKMLAKETWDRPTATQLLEWASATNEIHTVPATDNNKTQPFSSQNTNTNETCPVSVITENKTQPFSQQNTDKDEIRPVSATTKNKKTLWFVLAGIAVVAICLFFVLKPEEKIKMVFVKGGTFTMGCTSE